MIFRLVLGSKNVAYERRRRDQLLKYNCYIGYAFQVVLLQDACYFTTFQVVLLPVCM